MIQSNYIKMFGLTVYHTFYENSKCKCLHFIPSDNTLKLLHKFRFKMNTFSNGFDLYSNTPSTLSDLLDYILNIAKQDYFEFDIKCSNPDFMLFTAIPINWLGEINYSTKNPKNQNNNGSITLNETLETKSPQFFGRLKIYFEDLKKYQDNTASLLFEINFTARATQWQYYFINKNAIPLNNPVIREKANIQFDGPTKVTIQTGEQALLFTSSTTNITLSEKPKYKFDLVNENPSANSNQPSSKGKIIIKGLPVPDVSRIGIVTNNGQNQVTSPMYIYL